jgi:hypothetical protein
MVEFGVFRQAQQIRQVMITSQVRRATEWRPHLLVRP